MKNFVIGLCVGTALWAAVFSAHAWPGRNMDEYRAFRKATPCPATQSTRGRCRGYVVDHVIPLCLGGPDKASNMQWQTLRASRTKDVQERKQCRVAKKTLH